MFRLTPFLVALVSAAAAAEPPRACFDDYEKAQSARRDGKLLTARDAAIACSADVCPRSLSRDCVKWVGELQALVPGLVFDVRLQDGSNLTDVAVSIDGTQVTSKLDGKAISVDPGEHSLRFEVPGFDVVTTKVVALEGDRARKVSVLLTRPNQKVTPMVDQEPAVTLHRPVPLVTWVSGAISVATLITAAIVAGVGVSQRAALEGCKGSCDPDAVLAAGRTISFADGLLIGGLAAGAISAFSYFTRPQVPIWVSFLPGSSPALALGGLW